MYQQNSMREGRFHCHSINYNHSKIALAEMSGEMLKRRTVGALVDF